MNHLTKNNCVKSGDMSTFMKFTSLFLAAGLLVLATSCNDGLMDRSSLDMDAIDWAAVDENVFPGENNEMVRSGDDCGVVMMTFPPTLEALHDRYQLYLFTSSDQYFFQVELIGDYPFLFDEDGRLTVKHLITAGYCNISPKAKAWSGPFAGSSQSVRFPCKLLIDCEVRPDGGKLTFSPSELSTISEGTQLKGRVQVRILTEKRAKYSFSFNNLTPYLATGKWITLPPDLNTDPSSQASGN